MGRKRINEEATPARFPKGTLARIDRLLAEKEKRADFIREAVEGEARRREASQAGELTGPRSRVRMQQAGEIREGDEEIKLRSEPFLVDADCYDEMTRIFADDLDFWSGLGIVVAAGVVGTHQNYSL
ncbi:hypothetical protein [Bradyrhizobium sp. STM 3557]|uniref:hypothetical protein n=1 Tax=Bradyrhizobium sp. STM 3557 TaxID=578920 RepID=UPI003890DF56